MQTLIKTVLRGNASKPTESPEFEQNFAVILELRKELAGIDAGVRKWLASSKELAKSAKALGKNVKTSNKEIERISGEMDVLLDVPNSVLLKTLGKKTEILDGLIKQRGQLKELRAQKELYEKKLAQLEEQDRGGGGGKTKFDVQINTVRDKIATCTDKYVQELTELNTAMDFILQECEDGLGPKLVSQELASFRANQDHFFALCQQMIKGEVAEVDLERELANFQRKQSTTVANARVEIKELQDGEMHVRWSTAEPLPHGDDQTLDMVRESSKDVLPSD